MTQPVTVRTKDATGFACDIEAGSHRLTADEPVAAGGTDTGTTPFAMLLSALGSCTAITLRMYAARKGWPLEGVTVHLTHEKAAPGAEGPADRIHRTLTLAGSLDDEQRARLVDIANKCPVHKALAGGVAITTVEASR
jgi:putative redox protein